MWWNPDFSIEGLLYYSVGRSKIISYGRFCDEVSDMELHRVAAIYCTFRDWV
jgi:hypothetical protein